METFKEWINYFESRAASVVPYSGKKSWKKRNDKYHRYWEPKPKGPEQKVFGCELADAVTNAAQLFHINNITVSANPNGRVGAQIYMKSLRIRLHLTNAVPAIIVSVRCSLVYDRAPRGVSTIQAAVYEGATINASPLINIDQRFTILKEWSFEFDAVTQQKQGLEWYKKIGLPCDFDAAGAAGTIADFRAGALFFYYWSEGAETVFLDGNYRIRYIDA